MKVDNKIESLDCQICGKSFKSESGFCAHLSRDHAITQKVYWEKHFPRKNLSNGKILEFKSYPDYFLRDFDSVAQCKKYIRETKNIDYLARILAYRISSKSLQFAPSHLELCLSSCPGVDFYETYGGYLKFCQDIPIEPLFPNLALPSGEPGAVWLDTPIIVDSREQKPLEFTNSSIRKLSYGDYSFGGKTAIERKSLVDLVGTLGKNNIDRFEREIQRCISENGYLWVLVEDQAKNLDKIFWRNRNQSRESFKKYIFSQIKELQNKYPRRIQFCFTGSREKSKELIPKLLFLEERAWLTDLQFTLLSL